MVIKWGKQYFWLFTCILCFLLSLVKLEITPINLRINLTKEKTVYLKSWMTAIYYNWMTLCMCVCVCMFIYMCVCLCVSVWINVYHKTEETVSLVAQGVLDKNPKKQSKNPRQKKLLQPLFLWSTAFFSNLALHSKIL